MAGRRMKTRFPEIFDWMSEDAVFEKAFCNTVIMMRPGTMKFV